MKPRLLVVANLAMNDSSANGRTQKTLLCGFEAEELAQFYISGAPDFNCCKNYYRISDKTALQSVINPFFRKNIRGEVSCGSKAEVTGKLEQSSANISKSCKNKYIRNMIWSMHRWWTPDFEKFLDTFKPNAILRFARDTPFMYDIARLIAKKRNIPLFMYNCENYVLKEVLYAGANKNSIWHLLLKSRLKKSYARFMKCVEYCFYNTDYLKEKYQAIYSHKGNGCAVYPTSSMEDLRSARIHPETFTLLYCGNLGVGRSDALLSLANVLYSVDTTARLKIFGTFPDEESKAQLLNCPNVDFGGRISYGQVLEETQKCSMVVHCENPERVKNLQSAFSTKIADYLSCGIPILIYALRDYPFVQYMEEHKVAHIAENEEELKKVLSECIISKDFRKKFVVSALELADKNHSLEKNGKIVRNIICS